ncbi:Membrane associated serine protease, rhomboid family [Nocardioides scoriae]|uniref:Membrane associated serine protease, rhomboid family n=1 Tax=Nocardioides scoriae TaxID=642780 RepID=A0A1H1VNT4_9ACTN|nr:rhomboid family intramembrane serine protease [Nocardioides scoriae]SDS86355.1 Membrane associated serine protease, rhomboid family [Nocardioides scoriae]
MTSGVPEAPPTCFRHQGRETYIRCQRCDRPICPDCMRSASVGFQCPECVAEGARTTRQLVTPYGGQRSGDPRLTSFVLIGINALVWLAIAATGGGSSRLLDVLALLPRSATRMGTDGSLTLIRGVSDGAYWQLLTSAFTHVSLLHIGFNMLALYFLGPTLENVLGRVRFLALYLVSALAGSAAVMLFSSPNGQTLGASGAIFGLMGALAVIALKVQGQAQQVFVWIGLNLVITFTLPGISWQGHLGGLVGGAVIGAAMVYAPRSHRSLVQWSVTGLVLAAALVLIVARSLALGG